MNMHILDVGRTQPWQISSRYSTLLWGCQMLSFFWPHCLLQWLLIQPSLKPQKWQFQVSELWTQMPVSWLLKYAHSLLRAELYHLSDPGQRRLGPYYRILHECFLQCHRVWKGGTKTSHVSTRRSGTSLLVNPRFAIDVFCYCWLFCSVEWSELKWSERV